VTTLSTKDRILDAAEKLFADNGFAATSMRALTAEADVNLAAVHYHFGSKEALIEAVFARRLGPLNRERLDRLAELEEAAGEDPPQLERIVEAFVGPALRMAHKSNPGGRVFMRLMGHTISQPDPRVREMFTEQFREVFERFVPVVQRCLPELEQDELIWRVFFMIGSMAHTMALSEEMQQFSRGRAPTPSPEMMVRRLVPFATAGLAAPPSAAHEEGGK